MPLEELLPEYWKKRKNITFNPPFGMDHPRHAVDWYNYLIQEYNYKFNCWAFRGEDYKQYKNQPVNICLGDSFTLNIGGPIEHSWPSQLSKSFDIPTLNFGINGAGNDIINLLHTYLIDYFDVQNTFVMYSFFHRRYDRYNKILTYTNVLPDEENFEYFEKNKIENAHYVFLPPWCWTIEEKEYIIQNYKDHYLMYDQYNIENFDTDRFLFTTAKRYNEVCGSDWPNYKDFINNAPLEKNIYDEIFNIRGKELFHPVNRDGFHLNLIGNKMVCDYFLNQLNRTPQ